MSTDLHVPGSRWEFNSEVADVFDDMLVRSIPGFSTMRDIVTCIAAAHAQPNTAVLDIGCSRGGALAAVRRSPKVSGLGLRYIGIESSIPMINAARVQFIDCSDVELIHGDLRKVAVPDVLTSVVLSVLTLQFIPIDYRARVVGALYRSLAPRGALVLVEKVLGESEHVDRLLVDEYHATKLAAGYTSEDIATKAASLEGVLVSLTSSWNESLLRTAGFSTVECVWRHLNFAAWVAVK